MTGEENIIPSVNLVENTSKKFTQTNQLRRYVIVVVHFAHNTTHTISVGLQTLV